MGKLKISEKKKARPIPISFKPQHLLMLDELTKYRRTNRSRLIQLLIEADYNQMIQTIAKDSMDDAG